MNRVLGVLLGTLALLLACTGMASAATPSAVAPVPTVDCSTDGTVAGTVNSTLCATGAAANKLSSTLAAVTCTLPQVPNHAGTACITPHPGNGNHDPRHDGHFPGHGGPVGLPRYDSCGDYNLHGIRDIRRGDARYRLDWDRNHDGIACDSGDTTVIVAGDGDCSSLNTVLINDGNQYRGVFDRYNSLRGRYLTSRSARDLAEWRGVYNQYNDLRGRYLAQRQRTVVVCQGNTAPDVVNNYTIQQTPDQACGCNSSAGVAPASNPPTDLGSGGPQVYTAPKGAAEAGDGSTCTEVRRF
jgi:hypothetical protein